MAAHGEEAFAAAQDQWFRAEMARLSRELHDRRRAHEEEDAASGAPPPSAP